MHGVSDGIGDKRYLNIEQELSIVLSIPLKNVLLHVIHIIM